MVVKTTLEKCSIITKVSILETNTEIKWEKFSFAKTHSVDKYCHLCNNFVLLLCISHCENGTIVYHNIKYY